MDFRLGQATFSRGAMMAGEMNVLIIRQTVGRKSMKDVRYLYKWSKKRQRPFTMEEFPEIRMRITDYELRIGRKRIEIGVVFKY